MKYSHFFAIKCLCLIKLATALFYWETLMRAYICSTRKQALPYYETANNFLLPLLIISFILWLDVAFDCLKSKNIWFKAELFLLLSVDLLIFKSMGFDQHVPTMIGRFVAGACLLLVILNLTIKAKQTPQFQSKLS